MAASQGYRGEKEGASGAFDTSCQLFLPGQKRAETMLQQKHSSCCAGSKQSEFMWKSHQGLLFHLYFHL